MNKGFVGLIVVVIVALVVIIGGGMYMSKKGDNGNATTTVKMNTETNVSTDIQSGTIRSLLALGKDVTCTFEQTSGDIKSSGTTYISGTMMRGDFVSSGGSAGTMESHMIKQGDIAYTWSGTQGMKMDMSGMMDASASSSTQVKSTVDLDQQVDYKCMDWNKDDSKFTLPIGVTFTDMSAMMKVNTGAQVQTGASAQCAACDQAPSAAAKAQCKAALSCK